MMIHFALGALAVAAEPSHEMEMHSFLILARGARDATIQGDLDEARKQMKSLTEVQTFGDFAEEGKPHLIAMRAAAKDGAKAASVDDMGRAVSRIAAACGACHKATGEGPDFGPIGRPPSGDDLSEHMQIHDWASKRMWEGLVVSNKDRWEAGARALYAESWVHPAAEGDTEQSAFATRIHKTGITAVLAWNDAQRAALYGQFVANCAACHQPNSK